MTDEFTLTIISAVQGMITGGDAVVEVSVPDPGAPILLTLNGRDVTQCLTKQTCAGRYRGLLEGFGIGLNILDAHSGDLHARTSVRNFPIEGPLFSGPHLTPWRLTTVENGLGQPIDEHGNAAPRFSFHYMNSQTLTFEPYDCYAPPSASVIATTETDDGNRVPYIVRCEVGAANRAIYEIAVLFDPALPWTALDPQKAWNRKLWLFLYGGWSQFWSQSVFGIGQFDAGPDAPPRPEYWDAAPATSILQDIGLRRGHMVARTTFLQAASNSDTIRGAESLVLLKEHITKRYGDIRWTKASGASGGSIMQYMIANQYPGLLQGIIPLSSIHASWYVPTIVTDSRLLTRYFNETATQPWTSEEQLAVDGHWSEIVRELFMNVFVGVAGDADPTRGTNLPYRQAYDPTSNPTGPRATLQDYQVNYLGTRPPDSWSDIEQSIGRGFANRPSENVGIQYGLAALLAGSISIEQFLDLNEKIGWIDIDGNFIDERVAADSHSIETLHRGGFVNDAANMDDIAILDLRPPEPEDPVKTHTQFHTWIIRQALIDAHGHANNQAVWMVPGFSSITPTDAAFDAMDRWLTAIEADTSNRPLSEKVAALRPENLLDGIWSSDGTFVGDLSEMHRRYPSHGDARSVASCGDLRAFRVAKPKLKSPVRSDYAGVDFTADQWARLVRIFPNGVADWSQPGIGQGPTVPWLDYTAGPRGCPLAPTDRTP